MINYLKTLTKHNESVPVGSGVLSLANDIFDSESFWGSADITKHLDCTGKRAADYLDNIIKGKRYDVEVLKYPRRIKVIAINKQKKSTIINPELLALATAMKERGEFWSRKDIQQFLINNDLIHLMNYPSQIAHGFYLKITSNQNIITTALTNPPRVKVIAINL
jgi:hypothetical protein